MANRLISLKKVGGFIYPNPIYPNTLQSKIRKNKLHVFI